MANPFHYSKIKHSRTQIPPGYGNYRKYKTVLRTEFGGQCVYCRAVDRIKGIENFGVDHYRPQKHFPTLATEYLNLYYACNRCNSLKRDFWPSLQRARDGQFVPNPCDHVMFDHLRYKKGTVSDVSSAGAWTVELLDLNDPNVVQFRESVIGIVDMLLSHIQTAIDTVTDAEKAVANAQTPGQITTTRKLLATAQIQLAESQSMLSNFVGP